MRSSLCAVLILAPTLAVAQAPAARPERPSRALFGNGVGDASQLLTANATAAAGFDNNLAADSRGSQNFRLSDFNTSNRGVIGAGVVGLGYSVDHQRGALLATYATDARYYPSVSDQVFRRDRALARGSLQLPLELVASASAAYVPFSVAALHPTLFADPDAGLASVDVPASSEHYFAWTAGLGTRRQVSRRLTFIADTSYGTRGISRGDDRFHRYGAGAGLTYVLGRDLSVNAGYHYTAAKYQNADRNLGRHAIDVGLDYRRNLALWRRTTVSFGTGTMALTHPGSDSGRTRYRLTGKAELEHEIGRTWTAAVNFERGVQFVEGWPEPVFSDSMTASFGGSLSRRVSFTSNARASTGKVGIDGQDGGGFNVWHGSAMLSYAFSRHIMAGLRYATYHHRFDRVGILPPGFGSWADRQIIAVQVSVWAPLFYRARRANVTR